MITIDLMCLNAEQLAKLYKALSEIGLSDLAKLVSFAGIANCDYDGWLAELEATGVTLNPDEVILA